MEQITNTNRNTTSLGNVYSAVISNSYIGPRPFLRWDINQDGIVDIYTT
ncbi:MAG: hypothetical protein QXU09_03430 [Thermoproteota archaeon]